MPRRWWVPVLAAIVLFAPLRPALAQESSRLDQLGEELSSLSAEDRGAFAELEQLQARRAELDRSLASLRDQAASSGARLAAAQAEADRLGRAYEQLTAQIAAKQAEFEQAKEDVRQSAVLIYQRADSSAFFRLLESADKTSTLAQGSKYLEQASATRRADATRVRKLRDELEAQRVQLEEQKRQADAQRAIAAEEKAKLDALQVQQEQARAEVVQSEQRVQQIRAAIVPKIEAAKAAYAAESDRVSGLLQDGSGPAPAGNGQFIRPVGGPITSGFGSRTDPVTGGSAFHAGIDIAASCGTPIHAAATGRVVQATLGSTGYGNMVVINHGNGLGTLYGHQSQLAVSTGQVVATGEVIGYVGSTGKSTGCHLHFEVRANGNPVNPLAYL